MLKVLFSFLLIFNFNCVFSQTGFRTKLNKCFNEYLFESVSPHGSRPTNSCVCINSSDFNLHTQSDCYFHGKLFQQVINYGRPGNSKSFTQINFNGSAEQSIKEETDHTIPFYPTFTLTDKLSVFSIDYNKWFLTQKKNEYSAFNKRSKNLLNSNGTSFHHISNDQFIINGQISGKIYTNAEIGIKVPVSTYDPIISYGADYGNNQYVWAMNTQHKSRVRQNGLISHVQFYLNSLPSRVTSFWFFVWRKNGTKYNLIGEENIFSKLEGGMINLIKLNTLIYAQEGDYIGWGYEASSEGDFFLKLTTGINGVRTQTTLAKPSTGYNWDEHAILNSYLPIVCYMNTPDAVFIGNSIMSGYNNHVAYTFKTGSYDNPSTSIPYKVAALNGWIYQNMSIGGQTSAEIAGRFENDVCKLKPCYVIIECGVNDIALGETKANFLNNYKSMLEFCKLNYIKPIVIKIIPWSNGSNVQLEARDAWNDALSTLALTYNSIVINADTVLGQFRVGGNSGNLWDLQSSYSDDGVHLTVAGNNALSNYIVSVVNKNKAALSINEQPTSINICAGTSNTFSVAASGEVLSYQWQLSADGGNNWNNLIAETSSQLIISNVSLLQNNYRYRCIVNGTCMSSVTSNVAVLNVTAPNEINVQPADAALCNSGVIQFTVNVSGTGNTFTWQRSTDGGNSFENILNAPISASYTVNIPGTDHNNYQYRVVINNNVCPTITSNAAVLTVNPLPVVSLSASPYTKLLPGLQTTITANIVPTSDSIQWLRNGSNISNSGNILRVNIDILGSYKAIVTGVGGCIGESEVLSILDSSNKKIFFYPNPNQGQFLVRYNNPQNMESQTYIRVYNTNGAKVFERLYSVSASYEQMLVNLITQKPGIYLVELSDRKGNRFATGKVYIK